MNECLPGNSSVCNSSPQGLNNQSPSTANESSQTVSKLLLLSIFSIAARYVDEDVPEPSDKIWDAGGDYLTQAKRVLGTSRYVVIYSVTNAILVISTGLAELSNIDLSGLAPPWSS